jgi:hypothetical protein
MKIRRAVPSIRSQLCECGGDICFGNPPAGLNDDLTVWILTTILIWVAAPTRTKTSMFCLKLCIKKPDVFFLGQF